MPLGPMLARRTAGVVAALGLVAVTLALPGPAAAAAAPNLLTANQASVESGTAGFQQAYAGSGTLSRSTAAAVDGVASLALTATSSTTYLSARTTPGGTAATAGRPYSASVAVRAATSVAKPAQALTQLRFWSKSGAQVGVANGPWTTVSSTGWTTAREANAVAPTGTTSVSVFIVIGTGAVGDTYYADTWGVWQSSTVPAWASPPAGADTTPPSVPGTVTLTSNATAGAVTAAWGAATDNVGVASYRVFLSPAPGTGTGGTPTATTAALTWTSGKLAPGSYAVQVQAVDTSGLVGPATAVAAITLASPPDTTPPSAPGTVTLGTDVANGLVTVSWGAATDNVGVASYRVFLSPVPGSGTGGAPTATTSALTWTSSPLAPGSYAVQVLAVDTSGLVGPATPAASVTLTSPTDTAPPSAPGAVTLGADVANGLVTVSWSAATDNVGVASYRVFLAPAPGAGTGGTPAATTAALTWTSGRLAPGAYAVQVQAVDTSGLVGPATAVAAITLASSPDSTPPSAPGTVTLGTDVTNGLVTASWIAATDDVAVSAYQVFLSPSPGSGTAGPPSATTTALTWTSGKLAPGSYVVQVQAVDTSGLVGPATTVATVVLTPPPPPTANLLTTDQSSAESSIAGLEILNGDVTLSRTTTMASDGAASFQITTVSGVLAAVSTTRAWTPAVAGTAYSASLEVATPVPGRQALVQLRWYGPTGSILSTTNGSWTTLTSAWTRVTATNRVAPTGTAFVSVALVISTPTAAGETYYSDRWALWASPTQLVWTPGNAPSRPIAVFLGDSYTAGTGASAATTRWSATFAAQRGWLELDLARGGTGYLATSGLNGCGLPTCPSIPDMATWAVAANPDVVVVAGGRNDLTLMSQNPAAEQTAITTTLARLRAGLPSATIILVSPFWDASAPPSSLATIAGWEKAAATTYGAVYVDGAAQWLVGHPEWITSDNVHPNDLGHAQLAARLQAALG